MKQLYLNFPPDSEVKYIARHWRIIILGFFGWTLFGVFFALQNYVNGIYFGQKISFGNTLAVWLICGYAWMFLTPVVIYLSERFFIERGQFGRNLITHFLFGSLLSLLQLSVFIFARQWFLGNPEKPFSFSIDFQRLFVGEFHINLLIYWIVVGIWHLRLLHQRYLERMRETARLALSTSQLETQLANAQLETLKMQIHPHFLFNTLNSISVLMRDDAKAANQMLVRLSELLRVALKSGNAQEVSLKDELEFLRGYLEIEQVRFQDRLKVTIEAAPETLEAKVPNLILQPLVENAIRHAVAPRAETTSVEIRAVRENGNLQLIVRDDGEGISEFPNGNGIGLANTRARLEKLYGANHDFQLAPALDGNGLQIMISIPFRRIEDLN